jgi:hypothetical protein
VADEDEAGFEEFADSAAGADINFGKINPVERQHYAMKALREQKASWQTDGKGIRGDASLVSNASANLVWPSSSVTRRTNPEMDAGAIEVGAEVPTGE